MIVIAKRPLREFWENPQYADAETPLNAWWQTAKAAEWKTPQDVKNAYGNASFIANNRVVFNIAGNKYRLIVQVDYPAKTVFVRFIGTHTEYDKVDAATVWQR